MAEFTSTIAPFSTPKVRLISQEGESFDLAVSIANQSELMKGLINKENKVIPLNNVKSSVLSKIIQFCSYYDKDPMNNIISKPFTPLNDQIQSFYAQFVNVEVEILYEITAAANELELSALSDLCYAKLASYIAGKSSEEIRSLLHIQNDFSAEESAFNAEELNAINQL
eukprot:gene13745-18436_t